MRLGKQNRDALEQSTRYQLQKYNISMKVREGMVYILDLTRKTSSGLHLT